jgi:hypothetical protein
VRGRLIPTDTEPETLEKLSGGKAGDDDARPTQTLLHGGGQLDRLGARRHAAVACMLAQGVDRRLDVEVLGRSQTHVPATPTLTLKLT